MEVIDLLLKFGNRLDNEINQWLNRNAKYLTYKNETLGLKAGDVITFINGYDVPMKTKITAFDRKTGNPYLYWDCFWFAINSERIL